ncbi:MAG TPA: hypothetical protein PLY66_02275 [Acidobacteriota bacterium]|nr:hypothetical protein [Acidobacteriota bacterium]HQF87032.1 hypothetical protein [Acidobacteriota bacterium]HQG91593.1 hypothetical protein [Acidobacteriota bacterium]HQK87048.1 hypothetical protein [Acidobacteriota bacterium]
MTCIRLFLLSLILSIGVGCAWGAAPSHHVLLQFDLAPTLLVAAGADLRLQLVIINLDGHVAFRETASLAASGSSSDDVLTYEKLVMLPRGEYLVEGLFFDPGRDTWEVVAAPIRLDKKSPREATVRLSLDQLSQTGYRSRRRVLEFNPDRLGRLFFDHMLWDRIQYGSIRETEEWGSVFARIKMLAADLNFSPFAQNWQKQTAYAPPDFLLPYVVADRIFDMTVRADNLRFLRREMQRSGSPGGPDPRRVFTAMDDEAGDFMASYRRLNMAELFGGSWDKSAFKTESLRLDGSACRTQLAELIPWLWTAVERNFYTAHQHVSTERLALEDPGVLAEKIRLVADRAADLPSRNKTRD